LGPEPVVTPPFVVSMPPAEPLPGSVSVPAGKAGLEIRSIHAAAASLTTHLQVPGPGEVKQFATIRTVGGTVNACSAQISAFDAGEATLDCELSREVRRRSRARWLKLEVRTRFAPMEGDAETLIRRVIVPRS